MFYAKRIKDMEEQVKAQDKAIEKLTEKLIQYTTASIGDKKVTFLQVAIDVEKLKASDRRNNHSLL